MLHKLLLITYYIELIDAINEKIIKWKEIFIYMEKRIFVVYDKRNW